MLANQVLKVEVAEDRALRSVIYGNCFKRPSKSYYYLSFTRLRGTRMNHPPSNKPYTHVVFKLSTEIYSQFRICTLRAFIQVNEEKHRAKLFRSQKTIITEQRAVRMTCVLIIRKTKLNNKFYNLPV